MRGTVLRSYYRYMFVVVIFLCTLNLQFFGISQNWLKIPLLIVGFFLCIYDLWKGKIDVKTYSLWLVLGYCLCLFLATVLNQNFHSLQSYLTVGLQFVIFFLLYANEKDMQLYQIKKEMRIIHHITCVVTFIVSFISLIMFSFISR